MKYEQTIDLKMRVLNVGDCTRRLFFVVHPGYTPALVWEQDETCARGDYSDYFEIYPSDTDCNPEHDTEVIELSAEYRSLIRALCV